MFQITSAALTNPGLKRTMNEDSFCVLPDHSLFVISDGMGGHTAGEIASQLTVSVIGNFIKTISQDDNVTWPFGIDPALSPESNKLINAIKIANQTIYQNAKNKKELKGMGATVAALHINQEKASLAHVGDSRIYRIRNNQIEQLTRDHSWINEQLEKEKLSPEEIRHHQWRNVLTRALGIEPRVEVDVRVEKAEAEDHYILCSDGLSRLVDELAIKTMVLKAQGDLPSACQGLIKLANDSGGDDNITVILVHIIE